MQVNLLSCITERNKHYTVCELISHLVQKKFNVMRTFRTLRDWLKPKTRAFGMNYGDYWNSIDHQSENIFPHITNKLLFHKHTSTYTYSSWFFFLKPQRNIKTMWSSETGSHRKEAMRTSMTGTVAIFLIIISITPDMLICFNIHIYLYIYIIFYYIILGVITNCLLVTGTSLELYFLLPQPLNF